MISPSEWQAQRQHNGAARDFPDAQLRGTYLSRKSQGAVAAAACHAASEVAADEQMRGKSRQETELKQPSKLKRCCRKPD